MNESIALPSSQQFAAYQGFEDPVALLSDGIHKRLEQGPFWQKIPDYAEIDTDTFLSHPFQVKHSLNNATPAGTEKLIRFIAAQAGLDFARDVQAGLARAPMAVQITPYILSLINWDEPATCPIRIQFLPISSRIVVDHPMVRFDSLGEKHDTKAPGLVHRYFDRVLFLPQSTCPVYCRYCTRSYAIGTDTGSVTKYKIGSAPQNWDLAYDYIRNTPQVEDVVISGGDCYNLHPNLIKSIAENLLKIDSIRRIRIATKGIGINPGRIVTDAKWTDAVIDFATKGRKLGKQVVIHTHINSPEEITWVTQKAMDVFLQAGVVVRNQSVLLRGVNDSIYRMALLVKRLSYVHIQPYYVYQHDLVKGVDDLRTSLGQCLAIEHGVRGITAGFNTPQFVVDAPGGGGKRIASTYDYYDPETGVSIYTAPSVKRGQNFYYFDPLHALAPEMAAKWQDPDFQKSVLSPASSDFRNH